MFVHVYINSDVYNFISETYTCICRQQVTDTHVWQMVDWQ